MNMRPDLSVIVSCDGCDASSGSPLTRARVTPITWSSVTSVTHAKNFLKFRLLRQQNTH